MNADALPVGFAPVKLLCQYADGHVESTGSFVSRELAEGTQAFLANLFSENSYHIVEETPVLPAFRGKL